MSSPGQPGEAAGARAIDVGVRLVALGLLGAWCFTLLRPFVTVAVWGAILAVALRPLFVWLKRVLGGNGTLAAVVVTVVGLAVMIGPVGLLLANLAGSLQGLVRAVTTGALTLPPPPPDVAGWPWIGPELAELWAEASSNLEEALRRFTPQLQRLATSLLGIATTAGVTLLQFVFAILLAGVLLPNTETINAGLTGLVERLTPARGRGYVGLAAATVRNVARGVVGIAFLQGLLLGLGFLAAGIPFAGVWTLLSIILAIVQIGPMVIVLGTLIYAWTSLDTTTALLFTLWMGPASIVDNILRPIVMAQGLPVPMAVILVGLLGGTLVHGLVGLFIGPVILALGWEVLRAWVRVETPEPPQASGPP